MASIDASKPEITVIVTPSFDGCNTLDATKVTLGYALRSHDVRAATPTMDFYERIDALFKQRKVNRAQVGRETGMSGQAVTQKLQKKSAITPFEIGVYARYAGITVAEALGDNAVVLELKDEQDLIDIYRQLTPEQRSALLGLGRQLAAVTPPKSATAD